MKLAYCDYISNKIQESLREDSYKEQSLIHYVDKINWDLHPEEGYFVSTKKTIEVTDVNGKKYMVTVEEI